MNNVINQLKADKENQIGSLETYIENLEFHKNKIKQIEEYIVEKTKLIQELEAAISKLEGSNEITKD
jgi:hypothetical protein